MHFAPAQPRRRQSRGACLANHVSQGNIFTQIPSDLSEELFETLAQSSEVKIERIISSGQTSPKSGWYDQKKHEWVMVLKGAATIQFQDGTVFDLAEGDYLNIPAHKRHRVIRTSSDPETVWLAIHY